MKIKPIKAVASRVSNQGIQHSNHRPKAWKFLVAIFIALFVLCFGVFRENMNVLLYDGPSQIKTLADQSGMNTHGKALFFSTSPEVVDYPTLQKYCPATNDVTEFGCFISDKNKIYILNISDTRLAPLMAVAASHEMLHKAYSELDSAEKQSIDTQLDLLKNSLIDNPLQPYIDAGLPHNTLLNELHSFVGTEVIVNDPILVSDYSKYFDGQTKIVDQYQQQKNTIAAIETELTTDKSAITNFKTSIIDRDDNNQNQVVYYINIAGRNGDSVNYYNNLRVYNSNIPIIQKNINTYNSLVDAYNAKLLDYTALFNNLKSVQNLPAAKQI